MAKVIVTAQWTLTGLDLNELPAVFTPAVRTAEIHRVEGENGMKNITFAAPTMTSIT